MTNTEIILAMNTELNSLYWTKEEQNNAIDMAVYSMVKQEQYKLQFQDTETLTGICKYGRVLGFADGESYCRYCGQRVTR